MDLKKLGTLVIGLMITGQAQAAQSTATSMSVSVGTSNGTVGALALAGEGKIVNLYTNRKGKLTADFNFSASGLNSSLALNGVIRPKTAADTFTFKVRNSSGIFINVLAISGGTTSKAFSQALPAGSVVNGSILIRLVSSAGANDVDLDQLIVVDSATGSTTEPVPVSPSPTPTPTPTPPPPVTAPVSALPASTSWYWQLQGNLNMNVAAKVYDIDLYDNTSETFASLKQSGHTVICYFSGGTYEDWRPDAKDFPLVALGNNVAGWAGERWLDIRNQTVRDIMVKRMDMAKSKGCDGLEPDNVDGYTNKPGFPLTAQDQIDFNSFLADQAHARGMIIALKNSTDLVNALVGKFDFAVVEECFKYNECGAYAPFIQQNKAVLNAEYSSYSSAICSQAASMKFSTVFYNLALDGKVFQPCP